MKRLLSFLLALLFFAISACNFMGERVHGNGNIKTETRPIGAFRTVDVSSNIKLHVKQDSVFISLRIETDQNLMQYIETRMDGDVLRILARDHYNLEPSKSIDIYVSGPVYRKLVASGACDIFSDNTITSTETLDIDLSGASNITLDLKAPKVATELSGASKVVLKGETKDFTVNGSGASEIRCYNLMAENVDVDLSGAGNAEVFASGSLKAELSGAGEVKYKGNPSVNQSVSGAGSIRKVD